MSKNHRVKLYRDSVGPVLAHSASTDEKPVYGRPLNAFGYAHDDASVNVLPHDLEKLRDRKAYWRADGKEVHQAGSLQTNLFLHDTFLVASLYWDAKYNDGKGAVALIVDGGIYRTIDLSKPDQPEWTAKIVRPHGTGRWDDRQRDLSAKTQLKHRAWDVKPGQVTGALVFELDEKTGEELVKPAIVWVKPSMKLGVYTLDDCTDTAPIEFNRLPEFAGKANPTSFIGERAADSRERSDGVPPFYVSVQWDGMFLRKFVPDGSKEAGRSWLTADSWDRKHWYNLRITTDRPSYMEIATGAVTALPDAPPAGADKQPEENAAGEAKTGGKGRRKTTTKPAEEAKS